MNLFYNPQGVGDVAFLQIEPTDGAFDYNKKDDEDNILTEYEKKFSDKSSRIYRMEAKFHKNL